jgi:Tfp pilus assembly protein PilO
VANSLQNYPRPVQAALFGGLAVLVAAAAVWYWVLPLNEKRLALEKQVADLRAQNERNRIFEQQLALNLKRIAEAEAKLRELRTMVPDEANADEVVRTVREAEQRSTIHVRSLVSQPVVRGQEYVEVPFKIRADGNYYGLLNFFDRLGQAQRITNVSGLALGPAVPGGPGTFKVDPSETVAADFILSAYYNLPPGAAAPTAAAKKQ